MTPDPARFFVDEQGQRYQVRIAPRELTAVAGVSKKLKAVVFETEEGYWVGAAPVYAGVALDELSNQELERLLKVAMRKSR